MRTNAAGAWVVVAIGIAATAACGASATKSAHSVPPGVTSTPAGSPDASSPPPGVSLSSAGRKRGATSPTPSTDGIHQTVPSVVRKTNAPVPLTVSADFGDGVTASITSLTAVTAQARGPGEVSGPGVEVKVRLVNGRNSTIPLDGVAINVFDAAGTPGAQMTQSPAPPFTGSLAAHQAATGDYVFTLPTAHRSPITVNFSYTAQAPIVLFVGNR